MKQTSPERIEKQKRALRKSVDTKDFFLSLGVGLGLSNGRQGSGGAPYPQVHIFEIRGKMKLPNAGRHFECIFIDLFLDFMPFVLSPGIRTQISKPKVMGQLSPPGASQEG